VSWWLLVVILPIIMLIVVAGVVMVVALCRATPADVPLVLSLSSSVLGRLADRVPRHDGRVTRMIVKQGEVDGEQSDQRDVAIGQLANTSTEEAAR
jgi:hypothetical protein